MILLRVARLVSFTFATQQGYELEFGANMEGLMASTATKRKPPMRKTAAKSAAKRSTARRAGTGATRRATPPR